MRNPHKKRLTILLIVLFSGFNGVIFSQSEKFSFNFPKEALEDRLNKIISISNQNISFNSKLIEKTEVKELKADSTTVEHILIQTLANTGFAYKKISNSSYVIIKEENASQQVSNPPSGNKTVLINGTVRDMDKQPIIGAAIFVLETKIGTTTDINGNFSIKVKEKSVVQISYLGYAKQQFIVQPGVTIYTVDLSEENHNLNEVIVSGRQKKDNERALLDERKKATVSQDAISKELMEKSGALNATAALEKVTGITVANGKEISIRGLGDRNVVGQINGTRMASANADNNSVQMDLVPAGLLDNITVYKSINPDKPADATAGIVELRTKSFPEKRILNFSAQTGTNTNVGFGGFINSFQNSDLGMLGENVKKKNLTPEFLDLANQYPSVGTYVSGARIRDFLSDAYSTAEATAEARRINNIMQKFDPVLATSYKQVNPNMVFSANYGDKFNLGSQTIGFIIGGNYFYTTESVRDGNLTNWSVYDGVGTASYPYFIPVSTNANNVTLNSRVAQVEQTGIEKLTYGGIVGLGWRFLPENEVSVNLIKNKSATAQGSSFKGEFVSAGAQFPVYSTSSLLKQEETLLDVYQALGKHKILPAKATSPVLDWAAGYSKSRQNSPDYRYTSVITDWNFWNYTTQTPVYSPPTGGENPHPEYSFWSFLQGNKPNAALGAQVFDPNMRTYRTLDEKTLNLSANLVIPFNIAGLEQKFKTGYTTYKKERKYLEYNQSLPSTLALFLAKGDLNNMIAPTNVGIGDGLNTSFEGKPFNVGYIYNAAKTVNNYSGYSMVTAGYLMLETQLGPKMRVTGGVRFEQTDIHALIDTVNIYTIITGQSYANAVPLHYPDTYNPNIDYKPGLKPYYSVNAIYSPIKNVNVRGSFNTTLARAELREMIPVTQYDPFQFAIVTGNPDLKNQFTQAAEVRVEWFPKDGEVFAVTVFGKLIYDQLIQSYTNDSIGTKANGYTFSKVQYLNDRGKGQVYGWEFEGRKKLDFISHRMANCYVGANLMLAASHIKKNTARLASSRLIDSSSPAYSPLMNQPAYSINTYIDFTMPKHGTSVSVNFNMVGERLKQIVLTGEPDIYTQPVPRLDVTFSQKFLKYWTFKGYVKNILDPFARESYSNYGDKGSYYSHHYYRREYKQGTEVLLGLSYDIY